MEDYPFGDDVAVFKVVGTMFALVPLLGQPPGSISLNCDPDLAVGLRARHLAITAGYHLNKRHSARGTRRTPRSPRSHRPPRRSPD